jgi:hypothetical protein
MCSWSSCGATSGMSPCGFFGKVVRQPFGSSGFLDPLSLLMN